MELYEVKDPVEVMLKKKATAMKHPFGGAMELLPVCNMNCNMCYVRENRDDLAAMMELVRNIGLEFVYTTYVFPPVRGGDAETFVRSRMSPGEAAVLNVERTFQASPDVDRAKQAKAILKALTDEKKTIPYEKGLSCTAGKSGFWIDWEGKLCTCGMLPEPSFSLKEYTFEEAWGKLVPRVEEFETSKECHDCRKKFLCPVCAAGMYTETGDMKKVPPYLCEMTDEMIKIMFGYLDDDEKKQIRTALKACGLIYNF